MTRAAPSPPPSALDPDEGNNNGDLCEAVVGNNIVQSSGKHFLSQVNLDPLARIRKDKSSIAGCVTKSEGSGNTRDGKYASNKNSIQESDRNRNFNENKEEPESNPYPLPHKSSSTSSDTSSAESSSSSSSNNDGTESKVPDKQSGHHQLQQLNQLQNGIRSRQKQLTKLLHGRERTAYAHMIQSQEEAVNSYLLGRVHQPQNEPPQVPPSVDVKKDLFDTGKDKSSSNQFSKMESKVGTSTYDLIPFRRPLRRIQSILIDEYYHTLPGAFSLVAHCVLYITVCDTISTALVWLCDNIINYLTGWHAYNWLDCTRHEHAFYLTFLVLSLVTSRVTGALYDWNENRKYTKRVEFHFRNKWFLKCWDVRLIDFFLGGELQEEYELESGGGRGEGRTKHGQRRKWGRRLKCLLDLVSFYVCLKCVNHFLHSVIVRPMSDITESVIEGLPSRKIREQPDQHSYMCSKVITALHNPYASDMLNWISFQTMESEEARNFIANAKECGWKDGYIDMIVDCNVDSCNIKDKSDTDDSTDDPGQDESSYFPLRRNRFLSVQDDEYIQKIITKDEYHDLVGEPNPKFYDPVRETIFRLIYIMVFFGLLLLFRVPFLQF